MTIDPEYYYLCVYDSDREIYTVKEQFPTFERAIGRAVELKVGERNVISGARLIEMGLTEY